MLELFAPRATVKMTGVRGTSLWELGGGVCTTSALVISNQSLPFLFFFFGKTAQSQGYRTVGTENPSDLRRRAEQATNLPRA